MSNILWFLNLKGLCFLLGFLSSPLAVYHRQSAPLHNPARTRQSVPQSMEFKPHDPPMLWMEAGVKYQPKMGGDGVDRGVGRWG